MQHTVTICIVHCFKQSIISSEWIAKLVFFADSKLVFCFYFTLFSDLKRFGNLKIKLSTVSFIMNLDSISGYLFECQGVCMG